MVDILKIELISTSGQKLLIEEGTSGNFSIRSKELVKIIESFSSRGEEFVYVFK